MIVELQRDGTCAECGAALPAGTRARWYRNGAVYGIDCHPKTGGRGRGARRRERTAYERGDRSAGARASHYDRMGVYAADGTKLGSTCGCEDYPCCGH